MSSFESYLEQKSNPTFLKEKLINSSNPKKAIFDFLMGFYESSDKTLSLPAFFTRYFATEEERSLFCELMNYATYFTVTIKKTPPGIILAGKIGQGEVSFNNMFTLYISPIKSINSKDDTSSEDKIIYYYEVLKEEWYFWDVKLLSSEYKFPNPGNETKKYSDIKGNLSRFEIYDPENPKHRKIEINDVQADTLYPKEIYEENFDNKSYKIGRHLKFADKNNLEFITTHDSTGKKSGYEFIFSSNNALSSLTSYKNNLIDPLHIEFFPSVSPFKPAAIIKNIDENDIINSITKYEEYKEGKPHGILMSYFLIGTPTNIVAHNPATYYTYNNGRIVPKLQYRFNENGKVQAEFYPGNYEKIYTYITRKSMSSEVYRFVKIYRVASPTQPFYQKEIFRTYIDDSINIIGFVSTYTENIDTNTIYKFIEKLDITDEIPGYSSKKYLFYRVIINENDMKTIYIIAAEFNNSGLLVKDTVLILEKKIIMNDKQNTFPYIKAPREEKITFFFPPDVPIISFDKI